jgi:hypothetical protein
MEAIAQQFAVRDWVALLTAILWPAVVILAIILFRASIRLWLTKVKQAEGFGVKLTLEAEKTMAAVNQTPTDNAFDKISYLIDWNVFSSEVRKWALRNDARDAVNMGPNNFAQLLYDYGLPGGKQVTLRWKMEGDRRVLEYQ